MSTKATYEELSQIVELRMEVHRATARIQVARRKGKPVDPEDLVVARGSLEQLIELVEQGEQP